MDAKLVQEVIETNRPFVIRTAAGDSYYVPHRDYLAFSQKRTAVSVFYTKEGKERFAIVPLLTVTAIEGDAVHEV